MNETNHPARRLRHGDRPTEPLVFEDAAANKAAEEGELPFAELSINQKRALSEGLSALEAMADIWSAEIRLSEMAKRIADAPAEQRPGTIAAMIEQAFIEGAYRHFLDHKDAADRASRPQSYSYEQAHQYAKEAVQADRASRQVANKAEVEPAFKCPIQGIACGTDECCKAIKPDSKAEIYRKALSDLRELHISTLRKPIHFNAYTDIIDAAMGLATPPATTGASTGLRPTDDELWDATLRDRDAYHEWADKLAGAIAAHFGVDIGEHSNQNLPWDEALQAIENAEPVGASTVLTDARIDATMIKYSTMIAPGVYSLCSFGCDDDMRNFAREVAAQAGQVAVPYHMVVVPKEPSLDMVLAGEDAWEDQLLARVSVPVKNRKPYPSEENLELCARIAYRAMIGAAPSPAKESK